MGRGGTSKFFGSGGGSYQSRFVENIEVFLKKKEKKKTIWE